MKCPYCEGPLGLEDEKCPYCGRPNEFFKKHQEDMKHYQREFTKTQQHVYTKTRRFANATAPIIVLCVLILLNVAAAIFVSCSWDIASSMLEHDINKNASIHRTNLQNYIDDGDYYGLSSYFNDNSLYMADQFDEYQAVVYTADSYFSIYRMLLDSAEYKSYNFSEENISSTARSMTLNLDSIFNVQQQYSYNEALLADDKMEIIEEIQSQTKAILVTYAGLTLDEAEQLPDMSTSKQQELLERRLREL